jgi:hypothetical protein
MFCPLCQAEYREGVTWCRACDVELVATLEVENGANASAPWRDVVIWRGEDADTPARLEKALNSAGIAAWADSVPGSTALELKVIDRAEKVAAEVISAVLEDAAKRTWPELGGSSTMEMICPLCMQGYPAYTRFCAECMTPTESLESEERVAVVWEGDDPGDMKAIHDSLSRGNVPFHILDRQPQVSHILVPRAPMQAQRYALRVLPQDEPAVREVIAGLELSNVTVLETLPPTEPAFDPLDEPDDSDGIARYEQVWAGPDRETAEGLRFVFRENGVPCRVEELRREFHVRVPSADAERARAVVRQVLEGEVPEGLEET